MRVQPNRPIGSRQLKEKIIHRMNAGQQTTTLSASSTCGSSALYRICTYLLKHQAAFGEPAHYLAPASRFC
jgi:hypothetical protein